MIPSFLSWQQPKRPILHYLHSYTMFCKELAGIQTPHCQHAAYPAVHGVSMLFGGVCCTVKASFAFSPTSEALILQLLQQYHDSPLAGHYGVARTQALLAQYYT